MLAEIPAIDRILTSGGEGTALERSARLHNYSARAGSRLTIIAGGGVDEGAIAVFAGAGCVARFTSAVLAREGWIRKVPSPPRACGGFGTSRMGEPSKVRGTPDGIFRI